MMSTTPPTSLRINGIYLKIDVSKLYSLFFVSDCSAPIISLSPNNPLPNQQLLVQRSQAFSIGSSLQFSCFASLATILQWTIQACTPRCTVDAQLEQSVTTLTLAEILIPARTLRYGIYQMNLTVTMYASSQLVSSATTYIQIVPSPITINLIQFGVSIIIQKQQQMLTLDPGTFSVDPDATYFNSSVSLINRRKKNIYQLLQNWNYTYFCRIYGIDDPLNDLLNSSCFSRQSSISFSLYIKEKWISILFDT
jgi:hypothetical protein